MRRTRIAAGVAAALLAAVLLLTLRGGSDPYTVELRLANAGGLRDGSPVVVGGVAVGTVELDAGFREVKAKLRIERRYAPVGRDAKAAIVAQNILGQKQVRLSPGHPATDPAPDHFVVPARRTRASTDLDQLLSTLDADTRTRLAVVVNELGTSFAGRRLDFQTFVRDFAPALESSEDVLGELNHANRVLGNLVDNSDRFIGSLAASRTQLTGAIDRVGGATETVAAGREDLRGTLRRAPAALASARGFLAELDRTAAPLGATARLLADAAPSVSSTLDRLGPFTAAAKPALAAASQESAPALRSLGDASTAQVKRLLPTVADARRLVNEDVPAAGAALDGSVDNILAVVENWSRAIQFRDRMSHVFRGEASIAPALYERLISNLTGKLGGGAAKAKPGATAPPKPAPAASSAPAAPPSSPSAAKPADPLSGVVAKGKDALKQTVGTVDALVKRLIGGAPPAGQSPPPKAAPGQASSLLDFLLGP
jgi:virulence factor Mce-like protein